MLSKSDLQALRQCNRKLWLDHNPPIPAAPVTPASRRVVDGLRVGDLARSDLGTDIIWPPAATTQPEAAETAKQLLAHAPGRSAVEVPMVHSQVYARADALVWDGDGYILRETKASTVPRKPDKVRPAAPKDHHLDDVAIQAWVMLGSGLAMTRAELNLIDNQWRYPGGGDYSGLFRRLDVTTAIMERAAQVPAWIEMAAAVLEGGQPDVQTGPQCATPHPCPFQSHCAALDPPSPQDPIDLLPGPSGKALARRLAAAKGYTSILDPSPEELTGASAPLYRRIQTAHRTGQAVLEQGSADAMAAIAYPRFFFDFEGIDLAVPIWPGVRPYGANPISVVVPYRGYAWALSAF